MSFAELLATFVGRSVEVFFAENPPYMGTLESVDASMITVQINNTYYYSPPITVSILNSNIQYVRIIA